MKTYKRTREQVIELLNLFIKDIDSYPEQSEYVQGKLEAYKKVIELMEERL